MAVFSNGGATSPDIYIGVLCIFTTIACSLLNLVVFKHVSGKKKSLASCLYLTLSVADFLTAWVITLSYAFNVFQGKVEECRNSTEPSCNELYFKRMTVASLGQRVHAIFCWVVAVSPSNITAFLAMSRYYQIKYPLRRPHTSRVMFALVLSLIPIPVITGCAMFDVGEAYHVTITNQAWNYNPRILGIRTDSMTFYLLMIAGTWILEVGAILTSILTICQIVKRRLKPTSGERKGKKTKNTLKIVLTNGGNIAILVLMTIVAFHVDASADEVGRLDAIWYMMITVVVPSLISTVNPIIYISMTPKCTFRAMIGPIKPEVRGGGGG